MEKENKAKDFILEFFRYSKIKEEKGVVIISEVPHEFENFVGKKAPYKFVFDIASHNRTKDSELIMQGSYFLLAIRDYLQDKGQTSLMKINIQRDNREIAKNPQLKNYKIIEIKENGVNFIEEFSFLSTYQYLNDKKQSLITNQVKDKELINLNLEKFSTQKGKIEDIPEIDSGESYGVAKKALDLVVAKEIRPIKKILKEKLEKELFRVKDHYFKQIKEKDEEVETCANKIKMLQSKLRHTSYERDVLILQRTIRESKERLEMLKKKSYAERLKTEENFHINDEIEKHVLSIKNVLMNITVYYYPIYDIHISARGKKKVVKYDPILARIL